MVRSKASALTDATLASNSLSDIRDSRCLYLGSFYEAFDHDDDSLLFKLANDMRLPSLDELTILVWQTRDDSLVLSHSFELFDVQYFRSKTVKTSPIESLVEQAEPKLAELFALERGWDGYGGFPLRHDVANRVRRLLATFGEHTRIAPRIFPRSDGGLQLEWFIGADELEVWIDEDCTIGVYYESERESEPQEFDLDDPHDDDRIAPILRALGQ